MVITQKMFGFKMQIMALVGAIGLVTFAEASSFVPKHEAYHCKYEQIDNLRKTKAWPCTIKFVKGVNGWELNLRNRNDKREYKIELTHKSIARLFKKLGLEGLEKKRKMYQGRLKKLNHELSLLKREGMTLTRPSKDFNLKYNTKIHTIKQYQVAHDEIGSKPEYPIISMEGDLPRAWLYFEPDEDTLAANFVEDVRNLTDILDVQNLTHLMEHKPRTSKRRRLVNDFKPKREVYAGRKAQKGRFQNSPIEEFRFVKNGQGIESRWKLIYSGRDLLTDESIVTLISESDADFKQNLKRAETRLQKLKRMKKDPRVTKDTLDKLSRDIPNWETFIKEMKTRPRNTIDITNIIYGQPICVITLALEDQESSSDFVRDAQKLVAMYKQQRLAASKIQKIVAAGSSS